MKLKVKPEKLMHKRFEEAIKIMRLWPEYQRNIAFELLKHIQFLNEHVEKLENEIRAHKELQFFEEKKQFTTKLLSNDHLPQLSKSLKPIEKVQTSRAERFYHILKERIHDKYLNLNPSMNIDDMLSIANEYAIAYSLPILNREDFNNGTVFSNGFKSQTQLTGGGGA